VANYGDNGYINFSRLWELMERKNVNKQWLRDNGIHSNTVAKLTKNGNVTCEVICNLCRLLECQPGDIMEYKG
jgi:DNA-binding Xre family transcriptional regulator